jgi:hypothetical protein
VRRKVNKSLLDTGFQVTVDACLTSSCSDAWNPVTPK